MHVPHRAGVAMEHRTHAVVLALTPREWVQIVRKDDEIVRNDDGAVVEVVRKDDGAVQTW